MDGKKILNFLKLYVLLKAYWVFPALYLMGAMVSYFFGDGGLLVPGTGVLHRAGRADLFPLRVRGCRMNTIPTSSTLSD
jgi:hypothetical protein